MASETEGRVKEVIVDSRINKVLAMRTDSVAMLEALDAISEFYVSNTIEARRALRQDLELHNINLGKKFLAEFDQVRQKIEGVEEYSSKLEGECKLLASRVSEADENMKAFMEKASELENRRNNYSEQSKEIGSFLSRFQLSAEEVDTLYSAPIDQASSARAFFEALKRLKSAYTDCKEMVEKHSYSAGFELLDVLGQHQDMAYQRLFEWYELKYRSNLLSFLVSFYQLLNALFHPYCYLLSFSYLFHFVFFHSVMSCSNLSFLSPVIFNTGRHTFISKILQSHLS